MISSIQLPAGLAQIKNLEFPGKLRVSDWLFGNYLTSKGICWVQTSLGLSWKLDLSNPTHRWIVYGYYEGPAFLKWAEKHLPKDGVVVDSGANIGQTAIYFSHWVPGGEVLAFEPGVEASTWLGECLVAHPHLPITLLKLGLGNSKAKLFLTNKNEDSPIRHGAWNKVSESEGMPIEVVRLEDQLSAMKINKVDLWKLDVEGYELSALQGAESMLKEQAIKAVFVEIANDNFSEVLGYMAKLGYSANSIQNNSAVLPQLKKSSDIHTMGLFLAKSKSKSK